MTIRTIATAANLPNTDGIVKAWNLLNIGRHPGLDADLPADQAEMLLSYLAQPITRRKPEIAAVFAGLLADQQTVEAKQVKQPSSNSARVYNTGFGYYGTAKDAARGFDGIE